VGFVVDELELGQVFHRVPQFSSVTIIPTMLQTHSSIPFTALIHQLRASLNKIQRIML